MSIIPKSKPQATRADIETYLRANGLNPADGVFLVGRRAYFKDTMGKPGANDLNCYDDGIFVISPNVFAAFNGNCDPSRVIERGRALAQLIPGVYRFYKGKHKGKYAALRAYPEGVALPCLRNGKPSECSFINIHKGGLQDTWSQGCQTIPVTQWDAFINLVYSEMSRHNQSVITYILTENK
jgi:hypothetical protein